MQRLNCELASQGQLHAMRRIYRGASPTEMIYIETGTVVVSRSHIAGTVSRAQFELAVAFLEARYGVLRSVVEKGQFVERADDASAVDAWMSADTCAADAVYAISLNAGLDTQSRLYSLYVIAGDDTLDVFMLSSHAMTDATSLVELHSCLAHLCDCVVRWVAPAVEIATQEPDTRWRIVEPYNAKAGFR
jgi:hypothetical protein